MINTLNQTRKPAGFTPLGERVRTSASVLTMLAMGVITPVYAQDNSADEDAMVEEVVVQGFRQSLISAIDRKQNSSQIVDSIVAIDIGKLPDLNVAETLQRISGIQIERFRGEGSSIAIRGLTQVRTELNGRDIFSTTDGRGLSFEDVTSELLAGVDVYKNPAADQIEGGVGGTVNLRTRMPFDADGMLVSVSGQMTRYDLREDDGYGLSGLYSNRWDAGAGEMGFLLNLSWNKAVFREDSLTVEPFFTRALDDFGGQEYQIASGGGISSWLGDRERTGAAMAFQWQPSDNLELYASYLTSIYNFYDPQTGLFGYGAGEDDDLVAVPGSYSFDAQGNMLTGGFSNLFYQSFTRDAVRDSQTSDYSIGFKWDINEKLAISSDLQFVDSDTEFRDVTGFGGINGNPSFYLDLSGSLPAFSVEPDGYLEDPANYNYQAMMNRSANNVGDEIAFRTDLTWDFDDDSSLSSFTSGVRYTTKDIETRDSGFVWSAISGPPWDASDISQADYVEFPAYYSAAPWQSTFWRGDRTDLNFGPHFVIDPYLLRDHQNALEVLGGLNPLAEAPTEFSEQNQINVQGEETLAVYAMLNFEFEDFALPLDGNVGVRWVDTDVTADGQLTVTYREPSDTGTDIQGQSPIVVEQSYTEVLPSLNLRFFLKENLYWRVALSRGLSRPSFSDLSGNFTISENYLDDDNDATTPPVLDDPAYTGSGGNPGLKPLVVDQWDTALEWYYAEGSMVYTTLFHKDVENFTQNGIYFEQFEVPGKGVQTFEITAPVNGESGTIQGFELGVETFLDFLPAPFDSFGIQANYTFVDSEAPSPTAVDADGNPLIVQLEGLSEKSYNLVGIFERGAFSARLAYNWRDAWVDTTVGNGTGNLPIYRDDIGQLDGSVSYDIDENLSVTFDAVNITDETKFTYQAFPNRPRDYVLNDRRFGIRLRAKF